jgi:hypothetical protein
LVSANGVRFLSVPAGHSSTGRLLARCAPASGGMFASGVLLVHKPKAPTASLLLLHEAMISDLPPPMYPYVQREDGYEYGYKIQRPIPLSLSPSIGFLRPLYTSLEAMDMGMQLHNLSLLPSLHITRDLPAGIEMCLLSPRNGGIRVPLVH